MTNSNASSDIGPTKTQAESFKKDGFLSLLEEITFSHPFLSLLQHYLLQTNGGKKTKENCTQEFRERHKVWFKIFFTGDLIVRLVYLLVIVLVVFRGLGLIEYVKSLI